MQTRKRGWKSYGGDDGISLKNNALSYLFERLSYQINGKEIEGYLNIGVATTMKGLLTYQADYSEEILFFYGRRILLKV